jgi:hypothetical protein
VNAKYNISFHEGLMLQGQLPQIARTGAYLLVLWLGYLVAGRLLAVYNVSTAIWLGTFMATLHLAWAGTGAIALGMVWVLVLIWIAAISYAMPVYIHSLDGSPWAISIFMLWARGTILVLMLAFARRFLEPWHLRRTAAFWLLLGLVWSALGLGGLIYH